MVPRCAPPWATNKILLHLPRRWDIPPLRLFFDRWPAACIPVLNGLLIALNGLFHRHLATQARLLEEVAHMVPMIPHAKGAVHHLGDSSRAVQTSPRNPCASAPHAKSAGICAFCFAVKRG